MTDSNPLKSELQVVRGCLSGDGESVRRFVGRFRESVYGLCFRLLKHHQDAEDVVQDTFLRAFRSLHHWDQSRPLQPWLMTIAANRCKTALVKRARSRVQALQELTDAAPCQYENSRADHSDLAEELERSLKTLSPQVQECFVLFYREQLSCAEIAERMNRPEGTIKTWLHRSRLHLAQALRQRGFGSL